MASITKSPTAWKEVGPKGSQSIWASKENGYASDDQYVTPVQLTVDFDKMLIYYSFGITVGELPDSVVITGIKVEVEAHSSDPAPQIQVVLTKDGGTSFTSWGTGLTFTGTDSVQSSGQDGDLWGVTWTPAELRSANFGVHVSRAPLLVGSYLDHVQVTVYYSTEVIEPPAPTDLECDLATNPTRVIEQPPFSAIFNADQTEQATHIAIQVSEYPDFASLYWDSGDIAITSLSDGQRSELITYAGQALSSGPPGDKYYWRCRFKTDAPGVPYSDWSDSGTDPAEFSGVVRPWADPDYIQRHRVRWPAIHPAILAGAVQSVLLKTGERQRIATNGQFDESIGGGDQQIAYFNGKKHVVYVAEVGDDGYLGIYIVSKNQATGEWGTPFKVIASPTSFDSHYTPNIVIDSSGYIHIFYGCHYTPIFYIRSAQPNISGSLAGEPQTDVWIRPSQLPALVEGHDTLPGADTCTYPWSWATSPDGAVYIAYRDGVYTSAPKWAFHRSLDHGQTWSSKKTFINDTYYVDSNNQFYRVYSNFYYDDRRKRLHLAFVPTHFYRGVIDYQVGAWYCYSDMDETDEQSLDVGFNIWRFPDGSLAGRTDDETSTLNPVCGTNNTNWADFVTKVIAFHALDGVTENVPMYQIFSATQVLDANGNVYIFFSRKMKLEDVWAESSIFCTHWDEDLQQWVESDLSTPSQLMLRTTRQGLGLAFDREDNLLLYLPVGANTYYKILPTGDVDSDGVTRSSGADNFALVDDGFSLCDADGTYIDLAAGTGKASFAHGDGAPAGSRILGIEVEIVVRRLGATNSQVTPYISDGLSDASGDPRTVTYGGIPGTDSYMWFRQLWTTNPLDSGADWTEAAVADLQFGIACTGAYAVRVSRIMLRVWYSFASDYRIAGTELWLLNSADMGATWAKREITRNTLMGNPIINYKRSLSNNEVDMVISAGSDIFHITDERYGLVQSSGLDIRVFYAGAEIHRIIDYANLDETRIFFKVQANISQNRIAGANDHFVYTGNKNETSQPLSDPTVVYPTLFESFQSYDLGEDIAGQNGWSTSSADESEVSDDWPVAGDRCYKLVSNAGTAIATKTASLSVPIFLDLYVWQESFGGRVFAEVVGATASFGVGADGTAGRAGYLIDGVWTETSKVIASKNIHHLQILISLNTVSGWVNGTKIVNEQSLNVGAMSSIRLSAQGISYWDFIRVDRRPARDSEAYLENPETRGIIMGAVIASRHTGYFLIGAILHASFTLAAGVESLNPTAQAPSALIGAKHDASFTLAAGVESLNPTDRVVLAIAEMLKGADCCVMAGMGALAKRVIYREAIASSKSTLTNDSQTFIEAGTSTQVRMVSEIECLRKVQSPAILLMSTAGLVVCPSRALVSLLGQFAGTIPALLELNLVSLRRTSAWSSWCRIMVRRNVLLAESIRKLSGSGQSLIAAAVTVPPAIWAATMEACSGIRIVGAALIEADGREQFIAIGQVLMGWSGHFSASSASLCSSLVSVSQLTVATWIEAGRKSTSPLRALVEARGSASLQATCRAAVAWSHALGVQLRSETERLSLSARRNRAGIEGLALISMASELQLSHHAGVRSIGLASVESLRGYAQGLPAHAGWLADREFPALAQVEQLAPSSIWTGGTVIEHLTSVSRDLLLILEWRGQPIMGLIIPWAKITGMGIDQAALRSLSISRARVIAMDIGTAEIRALNIKNAEFYGPDIPLAEE